MILMTHNERGKRNGKTVVKSSGRELMVMEMAWGISDGKSEEKREGQSPLEDRQADR